MAWLNRFGWLIGPKNTEAKIVIVGLVNSGKSTIMQQLKPREIKMADFAPNVPIVGLHAEHFKYKTLTFVGFDLGDLEGFGNPWEDHYRDCHGIIFVVDSTDRLNMPLVKLEMDKLLRNQMVARRNNVPLLVLANKQDQPGGIQSLQMAQLLGLSHSQTTRPTEVFCCDGLTGDGLNEAMDWLAHKLKPICAKN